jgi:hypothetical protein
MSTVALTQLSVSTASAGGRHSGPLAGSGALPLGAVESNLNYALERGLWPVLNIEMRLLAAEMPPAK